MGPTELLWAEPSGPYEGRGAMLGTILLIILILLLIGALPRWGYSAGWGIIPAVGSGLWS